MTDFVRLESALEAGQAAVAAALLRAAMIVDDDDADTISALIPPDAKTALDAFVARETAGLRAERDALEAQILRERPLRQNTIDDAVLWSFGIASDEKPSILLKVWDQRKKANTRAEAAETNLKKAVTVMLSISKIRKSIENDVRSAHSNRGNGASEWMIEDDRDFRRDLAAAFDNLDATILELFND